MRVRPEGPTCMNRDNLNDNNLRFISFCFRSRFYHEHNLKLAHLLIQAKNCSLVEAAKALKVSRTLFYTKIFPDNQAFLSKTVTISGWGNGRSERRIKLSDETLAFSEQIQEFVEFSLGATECQRLKNEAIKILKNAPQQKNPEEQLTASVKTLQRIIQKEPKNYPRRLNTQAGLRKMKSEDLDKMVRGK